MGSQRFGLLVIWLGVPTITLGISLASAGAQTRAWPQVRATQRGEVYAGPDNGRDAPFRLFIADTAGKTVYRLECHNGNYDGPGDITYSGTFHCGLFAVDGDARTSGNLLGEEGEEQRRSDWLNRGRVLASQLRGRCAEGPYGVTRVFRLRAMRIVFRFTDLKWLANAAEPTLEQFRFEISVVPDPGARTSQAEATAAPAALERACL